MEKDYTQWWEEKVNLNALDLSDFYINSRDIYFTKMWLNIGFEENWKNNFLRPVLVLKKLWNLFFTIALTSKWKDNKLFYHKFESVKYNEDNQKYSDSSYCILSQVKVMDKRRFTEKMWYLPKQEFEELQKKLKKFLF